MLDHHGLENNPVLTGRSVHNQRIERLWLDVKLKVNCIFIDLFRNFEEDGLLDPANEVHLFALQYIFCPRINKKLQEFMSSWNNHPIRTEKTQHRYSSGLKESIKALRMAFLNEQMLM
eukprot:TCONS_00048028-protein